MVVSRRRDRRCMGETDTDRNKRHKCKQCQHLRHEIEFFNGIFDSIVCVRGVVMFSMSNALRYGAFISRRQNAIKIVLGNLHSYCSFGGGGGGGTEFEFHR